VGVKAFLWSLAVRVAWVAVALLIAFGSAGMVAAMNQPPGTAGRPELTWAGDAEMTTALDAAVVDLGELSDQVDQLGTTARHALSAVVAGDVEQLQATVTEGTATLGTVERLAADLDASLAGVPYAGGDWALYVSPAVHRRYELLAGTSGLTVGLGDDWAAFTGRSLAAARLTALLTQHDEQTAAAARLGSEGRYRDAIGKLDASDKAIAEARGLRDDLASTTDVSTLTSWLDRNAEYDGALRELYDALVKSEARVNDAVRKAFDREQQARSQLPGDTRGLVVIMSDVAQGGLNQAVIAIEKARGALSEALDAQQQLLETPDGTGSPEATPPA
jgi:hypothetical protein